MTGEYIVSVQPDTKSPFCLTLAGITYPSLEYCITRSNTNACVMEYIISGTGHIELNGRTYTASAGDMYIIPPYTKHTYYSDAQDPWCKIWFNSCGILMPELLRIYKIDHVIVFKGANGYDKMQQILKLCENKTLSGHELNKQASVIVLELIHFLSEHTHASAQEISSEATILKSYIDMNIDQNIGIAELSKQIFRSESQTIRIFKNAYAQTPYDYLLTQKIARANLFLQNTHMPVKEIALRLGFCDEHYFSNLYKKKTGRTPSDFRNSN